MRRIALFSLRIVLSLLLCAPSGARQTADAKRVAEWTDVLLAQAVREDGGEDNAYQRFAALDPDLQWAALQKALPKMENVGVVSSLYDSILQYDDANQRIERGQVKRLADNINPHLIEMLDLGITHTREEFHQPTLDLLNRDFGLKLTLKEYPDWRAKNGGRPVGAVMRDSVSDLVTQLKNEKEGMRTYLLDRLRSMPFTSSSWLLGEPEAKGIVAMRLTALRRQAAINAGLLDALAAILHGGAMANPDPKDLTAPGTSPVTRRKALAFLSVFKPDAAYLGRVGADIQREFTARIGKPGELQGVSPALLLACPGDWALPTLNHWIEADYLSPGASELIASLVSVRDPRVLPALFALLNDPEANAADPICEALTAWRELDGPPEATQEAWLAWWKKKPKTVPDAVYAESPPRLLTPEEALLRRLTQLPQRDARSEQTFRQLNSDAKVNFLRDHWKDIRSGAARFALLGYAVHSVSVADRDNPETIGLNGRLLELFDLGVGDSIVKNQSLTLTFIMNLTGNRFKDTAEYAAWRPAQAGKTNAALLREGGESLAKWLDESKPETISAPLNLAVVLGQQRQPLAQNGAVLDREHIEKIALVRRKALYDAGVTARIVRLLSAASAPALQARCIAYLSAVRPDAATLAPAEPTVRKIVEAETGKKNGINTDLLMGVALYDAPWASAALLDCLQNRYNENMASLLLPIVARKSDPRSIPTLISLLDISEPGDGQYEQVTATLNHIANLPENEPRDIHGWVRWWEKRRADYPADVRLLPYPRIGKGAAHAQTYSLAQEIRGVRLKSQPDYGYWRITSGYLVTLPPAPRTAAYIPGGAVTELTEEQKPGLLVVLTNSAADFEKQKRYWLDGDRSALKGRYVIALIVPQKTAHPKALWLLHAAGGADAARTAQGLTAAAIEDLATTTPLSRTRRYCLGIGEGGMAALACVLSPSLGLRGAVADTAPFRSADLPPLTNAKGKRVVLLRDQSSHAVPEFIQTVTQQTLTKAGAVLHAASYNGKSAPVNAAPFDALEAAITWLESGR